MRRRMLRILEVQSISHATLASDKRSGEIGMAKMSSLAGAARCGEGQLVEMIWEQGSRGKILNKCAAEVPGHLGT